MGKGRLETFSDGVVAILITIMVLELKVPDGGDWNALRSLTPTLLSYVLSFVYLGIYWNNHHHMFQLVDRVSGGILWANLHLLFWLSLVPVVTNWMGDRPHDALPTRIYGVVLLCSAIAFLILLRTVIHHQGPKSPLRAAVGRDFKGTISPILYIVAILSTFFRHEIAWALYVCVALIWLVPDTRIESRLNR
jgi:uncharacterized membrane protein